MLYWSRIVIICTTEEEEKSMWTIHAMDTCFTQWLRSSKKSPETWTWAHRPKLTWSWCVWSSLKSLPKGSKVPCFSSSSQQGAKHECARQKDEAVLRIHCQPYRLMRCDVTPAVCPLSRSFLENEITWWVAIKCTAAGGFFSSWKRTGGDLSFSDGKISTILQGVIYLLLDLLWSPF